MMYELLLCVLTGKLKMIYYNITPFFVFCEHPNNPI